MASLKKQTESSGPAPGAFLTTYWSVVINAGDSRSPETAVAMERLCRTYWYPLYAVVRRKGYSHDNACDLTQGFFEKFLEKGYLKAVDSGLGKFRTFLLTSMTHFLANEWDKSRAQKRGGGVHVISLDDEMVKQRYDLGRRSARPRRPSLNGAGRRRW